MFEEIFKDSTQTSSQSPKSEQVPIFCLLWHVCNALHSDHIITTRQQFCESWDSVYTYMFVTQDLGQINGFWTKLYQTGWYFYQTVQIVDYKYIEGRDLEKKPTKSHAMPPWKFTESLKLALGNRI